MALARAPKLVWAPFLLFRFVGRRVCVYDMRPGESPPPLPTLDRIDDALAPLPSLPSPSPVH